MYTPGSGNASRFSLVFVNLPIFDGRLLIRIFVEVGHPRNACALIRDTYNAFTTL